MDSLCLYCKEKVYQDKFVTIIKHNMGWLEDLHGLPVQYMHTECSDRLLATIDRGEGVVTKVGKLEYPLE